MSPVADNVMNHLSETSVWFKWLVEYFSRFFSAWIYCQPKQRSQLGNKIKINK